MSGAYVLLEDGVRFDGEAAGALTRGAPAAGDADGQARAGSAGATGEVVFNTAMSGYQEAVTDP
ncbi:MAG TPA: carbamoyl-phosphate synthase domain-containing protein, partial [Thermoleophilaceae bacterium]|nr:carbamoyl-phosphate synthase domain-containing protein [Thermoleophilaceae bacterium]